jgi:hypothetical protein
MNTKNNRNSLTLVMPALFSENKIKTELHCIEVLSKQLMSERENPRLFVVGHHKTQKFLDWIPDNNVVVKVLTDKKYNISKSLNMFAKGCTTDYFAFIHSDLEIKDKNWIEKFIYLNITLKNVGIIGVQSHTDVSFYSKQIHEDIFEVLSSDAIMFIKTDLFKKIGYFDEIYNGDGESIDFCYRAIKNNFKNYHISQRLIHHHHHLLPFRYKTENSEELLNCANESRKIFADKWSEFLNQFKKL